MSSAGSNSAAASSDNVDEAMQSLPRMAGASAEILERNNLKGSDIKLFVAHQANLRMLETMSERCGVEPELHHTNCELFGNTGASSSAVVNFALGRPSRANRS